jgi:hypothetical protein
VCAAASQPGSPPTNNLNRMADTNMGGGGEMEEGETSPCVKTPLSLSEVWSWRRIVRYIQYFHMFPLSSEPPVVYMICEQRKSQIMPRLQKKVIKQLGSALCSLAELTRLTTRFTCDHPTMHEVGVDISIH